MELGSDMSEEVEFVRGGIELLDEVRPLWLRLREHVCPRSKHFQEEMREVTWEDRKEEILGKGEGTKLMVDLVLLTGSMEKVGYCVSTLTSEGLGEVDSIFVEEDLRGQGIGEELMRRSLGWLEGEGANKVQLSVTYGNEGVLPFYEEHLFYPRRIILEKKPSR